MRVSVFGNFLVFIFPYSVRMWEKMDKKISEYGHFLYSACHHFHNLWRPNQQDKHVQSGFVEFIVYPTSFLVYFEENSFTIEQILVPLSFSGPVPIFRVPKHHFLNCLIFSEVFSFLNFLSFSL